MTLTPEQFNKLVTKEYFEEKLKDLSTKEDINKVLAAVDGIAKKHKDFEVELAANQGAHDRMSEYIKKHETRIKKLELKKV
ncbi:MAG: hypothetical protein Q8O93_03755 [bacterium]|nr:hypothetical protein [bacterium]